MPIIEATQAGHAFVYDQLDERLTTARARIAALFERLANPDARAGVDVDSSGGLAAWRFAGVGAL